MHYINQKEISIIDIDFPNTIEYGLLGAFLSHLYIVVFIFLIQLGEFLEF